MCLLLWHIIHSTLLILKVSHFKNSPSLSQSGLCKAQIYKPVPYKYSNFFIMSEKYLYSFACLIKALMVFFPADPPPHLISFCTPHYSQTELTLVPEHALSSHMQPWSTLLGLDGMKFLPQSPGLLPLRFQLDVISRKPS